MHGLIIIFMIKFNTSLEDFELCPLPVCSWCAVFLEDFSPSLAAAAAAASSLAQDLPVLPFCLPQNWWVWTLFPLT